MLFTKESKCSVSLSGAFKVFELLSIILLRPSLVSCELIHHTPRSHYHFISEFCDLLSVAIIKNDAFWFYFACWRKWQISIWAFVKAFNCKQHVVSPTRHGDQILNLVISYFNPESLARKDMYFLPSFSTLHPSIHPCPKTLRCSLGAHTLLILRQLLNSLKSTCCPIHVFYSNNLCAVTLPGFHIYYDKTSVSDRKPVISNGNSWRRKTPATTMHSDRLKATEATR